MAKVMEKVPYSSDTAPNTLLELLNVVDKSGKVHTENNFHFAFGEMFKGKRIIVLPGNKYNGILHLLAETTIQQKIKNKDLGGSQEQRDALQVLACDYKIHLMPKPEYILPVVAEFLRLCTLCPEVARVIHSFKIKKYPLKPEALIPGTTKQMVIPQFVIYLDLSLGKAAGNLVLKKLYDTFSVYDLSEIGLFAPRYSDAVNPLISYAQGGGDVKNIMTDSQKDQLLSQSWVHFNLPDQHLENPALPDLKILADLISKIGSETSLHFENIKTNLGSATCQLPHISAIAKLENSADENFDPKDLEFLLQRGLSEVLKKFRMKGRVLNPPRATAGKINSYESDIVICLPFILDSMKKDPKSFVENFNQAIQSAYEQLLVHSQNRKRKREESAVPEISNSNRSTNPSSKDGDNLNEPPSKRRKLS